jgi:hypothetical protein
MNWRIPSKKLASRRKDAAPAFLFLLLAVGLLWIGYQSRVVPPQPRRAEGHSIASAPVSLRLSTPEERHTLDAPFTAAPATPVAPFASRTPGLRAPPVSLS